ncbi:hypothetical protein F5Y03DRAFT_180538 [Xylaria venustula]|nr:hypothetical protein F5Y03DRAFT_180538 [Xylaria venustula]
MYLPMRLFLALLRYGHFLRGLRPCAHLTMRWVPTVAHQLSCRDRCTVVIDQRHVAPEKALMRGRGPERTSAELSNRPTMSASRGTYEHMPWFPGSPFGTYFSLLLSLLCLSVQREGLSECTITCRLLVCSDTTKSYNTYILVSSTGICNGPLWLKPQLRAMRCEGPTPDWIHVSSCHHQGYVHTLTRTPR